MLENKKFRMLVKVVAIITVFTFTWEQVVLADGGNLFSRNSQQRSHLREIQARERLSEELGTPPAALPVAPVSESGMKGTGTSPAHLPLPSVEHPVETEIAPEVAKRAEQSIKEHVFYRVSKVIIGGLAVTLGILLPVAFGLSWWWFVAIAFVVYNVGHLALTAFRSYEVTAKQGEQGRETFILKDRFTGTKDVIGTLHADKAKDVPGYLRLVTYGGRDNIYNAIEKNFDLVIDDEFFKEYGLDINIIRNNPDAWARIYQELQNQHFDKMEKAHHALEHEQDAPKGFFAKIDHSIRKAFRETLELAKDVRAPPLLKLLLIVVRTPWYFVLLLGPRLMMHLFNSFALSSFALRAKFYTFGGHRYDYFQSKQEIKDALAAAIKKELAAQAAHAQHVSAAGRLTMGLLNWTTLTGFKPLAKRRGTMSLAGAAGKFILPTLLSTPVGQFFLLVGGLSGLAVFLYVSRRNDVGWDRIIKVAIAGAITILAIYFLSHIPIAVLQPVGPPQMVPLTMYNIPVIPGYDLHISVQGGLSLINTNFFLKVFEFRNRQRDNLIRKEFYNGMPVPSFDYAGIMSFLHMLDKKAADFEPAQLQASLDIIRRNVKARDVASLPVIRATDAEIALIKHKIYSIYSKAGIKEQPITINEKEFREKFNRIKGQALIVDTLWNKQFWASVFSSAAMMWFVPAEIKFVLGEAGIIDEAIGRVFGIPDFDVGMRFAELIEGKHLKPGQEHANIAEAGVMGAMDYLEHEFSAWLTHTDLGKDVTVAVKEYLAEVDHAAGPGVSEAQPAVKSAAPRAPAVPDLDLGYTPYDRDDILAHKNDPSHPLRQIYSQLEKQKRIHHLEASSEVRDTHDGNLFTVKLHEVWMDWVKGKVSKAPERDILIGSGANKVNSANEAIWSLIKHRYNELMNKYLPEVSAFNADPKWQKQSKGFLSHVRGEKVVSAWDLSSMKDAPDSYKLSGYETLKDMDMDAVMFETDWGVNYKGAEYEFARYQDKWKARDEATKKVRHDVDLIKKAQLAAYPVIGGVDFLFIKNDFENHVRQVMDLFYNEAIVKTFVDVEPWTLPAWIYAKPWELKEWKYMTLTQKSNVAAHWMSLIKDRARILSESRYALVPPDFKAALDRIAPNLNKIEGVTIVPDTFALPKGELDMCVTIKADLVQRWLELIEFAAKKTEIRQVCAFVNHDFEKQLFDYLHHENKTLPQDVKLIRMPYRYVTTTKDSDKDGRHDNLDIDKSRNAIMAETAGSRGNGHYGGMAFNFKPEWFNPDTSLYGYDKDLKALAESLPIGDNDITVLNYGDVQNVMMFAAKGGPDKTDIRKKAIKDGSIIAGGFTYKAVDYMSSGEKPARHDLGPKQPGQIEITNEFMLARIQGLAGGVPSLGVGRAFVKMASRVLLGEKYRWDVDWIPQGPEAGSVYTIARLASGQLFSTDAKITKVSLTLKNPETGETIKYDDIRNIDDRICVRQGTKAYVTIAVEASAKDGSIIHRAHTGYVQIPLRFAGAGTTYKDVIGKKFTIGKEEYTRHFKEVIEGIRYTDKPLRVTLPEIQLPELEFKNNLFWINLWNKDEELSDQAGLGIDPFFKCRHSDEYREREIEKLIKNPESLQGTRMAFRYYGTRNAVRIEPSQDEDVADFMQQINRNIIKYNGINMIAIDLQLPGRQHPCFMRMLWIFDNLWKTLSFRESRFNFRQFEEDYGYEAYIEKLKKVTKQAKKDGFEVILTVDAQDLKNVNDWQHALDVLSMFDKEDRWLADYIGIDVSRLDENSDRTADLIENIKMYSETGTQRQLLIMGDDFRQDKDKDGLGYLKKVTVDPKESADENVDHRIASALEEAQQSSLAASRNGMRGVVISDDRLSSTIDALKKPTYLGYTDTLETIAARIKSATGKNFSDVLGWYHRAEMITEEIEDLFVEINRANIDNAPQLKTEEMIKKYNRLVGERYKLLKNIYDFEKAVPKEARQDVQKAMWFLDEIGNSIVDTTPELLSKDIDDQRKYLTTSARFRLSTYDITEMPDLYVRDTNHAELVPGSLRIKMTYQKQGWIDVEFEIKNTGGTRPEDLDIYLEGYNIGERKKYQLDVPHTVILDPYDIAHVKMRIDAKKVPRGSYRCTLAAVPRELVRLRAGEETNMLSEDELMALRANFVIEHELVSQETSENYSKDVFGFKLNQEGKEVLAMLRAKDARGEQFSPEEQRSYLRLSALEEENRHAVEQLKAHKRGIDPYKISIPGVREAVKTLFKENWLGFIGSLSFNLLLAAALSAFFRSFARIGDGIRSEMQRTINAWSNLRSNWQKFIDNPFPSIRWFREALLFTLGAQVVLATFITFAPALWAVPAIHTLVLVAYWARLVDAWAGRWINPLLELSPVPGSGAVKAAIVRLNGIFRAITLSEVIGIPIFKVIIPKWAAIMNATTTPIAETIKPIIHLLPAIHGSAALVIAGIVVGVIVYIIARQIQPHVKHLSEQNNIKYNLALNSAMAAFALSVYLRLSHYLIPLKMSAILAGLPAVIQLAVFGIAAWWTYQTITNTTTYIAHLRTLKRTNRSEYITERNKAIIGFVISRVFIAVLVGALWVGFGPTLGISSLASLSFGQAITAGLTLLIAGVINQFFSNLLKSRPEAIRKNAGTDTWRKWFATAVTSGIFLYVGKVWLVKLFATLALSSQWLIWGLAAFYICIFILSMFIIHLPPQQENTRAIAASGLGIFTIPFAVVALMKIYPVIFPFISHPAVLTILGLLYIPIILIFLGRPILRFFQSVFIEELTPERQAMSFEQIRGHAIEAVSNIRGVNRATLVVPDVPPDTKDEAEIVRLVAEAAATNVLGAPLNTLRPDHASALVTGFGREIQTNLRRAGIQLDFGAEFSESPGSMRMMAAMSLLQRNPRLHAILPAMFTFPNWDYNFFYLGAGLLFMPLMIYAQVLQYLIAMAVRRLRGIEAPMDAMHPLSHFVRSDMELRSFGFVVEVMGRWLIGHLYVIMDALLGRTFVWDEHTLEPVRFVRQASSLRQRMHTLMTGGYMERTAAYYMAFPEARNLYYGMERIEPFTEMVQKQWNDMPSEGPMSDAEALGADFEQGIPGTVGARLIHPTREGFYYYTPNLISYNFLTGKTVIGRVEYWNTNTEEWGNYNHASHNLRYYTETLEDGSDGFKIIREPAKFFVKCPHERNVKSTLMGNFFQYTNGFFAAMPQIDRDATGAVINVRWINDTLESAGHQDILDAREDVRKQSEADGTTASRKQYRDLADHIDLHTGEIISRDADEDEVEAEHADASWEVGYDPFSEGPGRSQAWQTKLSDILTLKILSRRRSGNWIAFAAISIPATLLMLSHVLNPAVPVALSPVIGLTMISLALVTALLGTRDLINIPDLTRWVNIAIGWLLPTDIVTKALLTRASYTSGGRVSLSTILYKLTYIPLAAYLFLATPSLVICGIPILGWLAGSIVFSRFIIEPLFRRITPISFPGGIQTPTASGLKAHYKPENVIRYVDKIYRRSGHVWDMAQELIREGSPRGTGICDYRLDNGSIIRVHQELCLREREIELIIEAVTNRPAGINWRETLHRALQSELMAVGNDAAGLYYHRSHAAAVMNAGDVAYQFGLTSGQEPLARIAQGMNIPFGQTRSWAFTSEGAYLDAIRIPSATYDGYHVLLDAGIRNGFMIEAIITDGDNIYVVSDYLATDRDLDKKEGIDHGEALQNIFRQAGLTFNPILHHALSIREYDRIRSGRSIAGGARRAAILNEARTFITDKLASGDDSFAEKLALRLGLIFYVEDPNYVHDALKEELKSILRKIGGGNEVLGREMAINNGLAKLGFTSAHNIKEQLVSQKFNISKMSPTEILINAGLARFKSIFIEETNEDIDARLEHFGFTAVDYTNIQTGTVVAERINPLQAAPAGEDVNNWFYNNSCLQPNIEVLQDTLNRRSREDIRRLRDLGIWARTATDADVQAIAGAITNWRNDQNDELGVVGAHFAHLRRQVTVADIRALANISERAVNTGEFELADRHNKMSWRGTASVAAGAIVFIALAALALPVIAKLLIAAGATAILYVLFGVRLRILGRRSVSDLFNAFEGWLYRIDESGRDRAVVLPPGGRFALGLLSGVIGAAIFYALIHFALPALTGYYAIVYALAALVGGIAFFVNATSSKVSDGSIIPRLVNRAVAVLVCAGLGFLFVHSIGAISIIWLGLLIKGIIIFVTVYTTLHASKNGLQSLPLIPGLLIKKLPLAIWYHSIAPFISDKPFTSAFILIFAVALVTNPAILPAIGAAIAGSKYLAAFWFVLKWILPGIIMDGLTDNPWFNQFSQFKTLTGTRVFHGPLRYMNLFKRMWDNLKDIPYSDDVKIFSAACGVPPEIFESMYHSAEYPLLIGTGLFPGMPILRGKLASKYGTKIDATPVGFSTAVRLSEEVPWLAGLSDFNYLPSDSRDRGRITAEDTSFNWMMSLLDTLAPGTPGVSEHELDNILRRIEEMRDDQAMTRALQFYKGMSVRYALERGYGNPIFNDLTEELTALPTRQLFQEINSLLYGMRAFKHDEIKTGGGLGAGAYSYGFTSFTANDLIGKRVGPFAPGEVMAYLTYLVFERIDQQRNGALSEKILQMSNRYVDTKHPHVTHPGGNLGNQNVREVLFRARMVDIRAAVSEMNAERDDLIVNPNATELRDATSYNVRTIGWMDLLSLTYGGKYQIKPSDRFRHLRKQNDMLRRYDKQDIVILSKAGRDMAKQVHTAPTNAATLPPVSPAHDGTVTAGTPLPPATPIHEPAPEPELTPFDPGFYPDGPPLDEPAPFAWPPAEDTTVTAGASSTSTDISTIVMPFPTAGDSDLETAPPDERTVFVDRIAGQRRYDDTLEDIESSLGLVDTVDQAVEAFTEEVEANMAAKKIAAEVLAERLTDKKFNELEQDLKIKFSAEKARLQSEDQRKKMYAVFLHPDPFGDEANRIKGALVDKLGFDYVFAYSNIEDAQADIAKLNEVVTIINWGVEGVDLNELAKDLPIEDRFEDKIFSTVPDTAEELYIWL